MTPNNLFANGFAGTGGVRKVFWGKASRSVIVWGDGEDLTPGGKAGAVEPRGLRGRGNEEYRGDWERGLRVKCGRGGGRECNCAIWVEVVEVRGQRCQIGGG